MSEEQRLEQSQRGRLLPKQQSATGHHACILHAGGKLPLELFHISFLATKYVCVTCRTRANREKPKQPTFYHEIHKDFLQTQLRLDVQSSFDKDNCVSDHSDYIRCHNFFYQVRSTRTLVWFWIFQAPRVFNIPEDMYSVFSWEPCLWGPNLGPPSRVSAIGETQKKCHCLHLLSDSGQTVCP